MQIFKKHWATAVRIVLGVGLLGYILVEWVDVSALASLLAAPQIFAGFVLLTLIGVPLESVRLVLLCRAQNVDLDFIHGCRLASIGIFFNFCMPGGAGGEIAKLYYLTVDDRGRFIQITTVLLVNRIAGLLGMLVFLLALAPFTWDFTSKYPIVQALVGGAALALVVILCVAALSFSKTLRSSRLYEFIITKAPLNNHLRTASDAMFAYRDHKTLLIFVMILSILGVVAASAMFSAAGFVLFSDPSVLLVSFLSMLGMVANALPLTPGGLGVGEAAFDALFGLAGYGSAALLLVTWRIANVPVGVGGGMLYMAGIRRRHSAAE